MNDLIMRTKKQIEKFMMNYDIDYKLHEFDSYNNKFEELVKIDVGFKVYFLDIKTKLFLTLEALVCQ